MRLRLKAAGKTGELATRSDHPVARRDDRDRIAPVRRPDRAHRLGCADLAGNLRIGPRFAERNGEQRSPNLFLEFGPGEIELEVERLPPAGEIIRQLPFGFQQNRVARILADDILSVLDWLAALNGHPEGEWFRRLDFSRVGVMGHSIGGAAGAEACGIDPRIGAALNFDGWTFGDTLRFGLAKPWMVIYGKGIEKEPAGLAAQPEGVQRYWQMNRENHETVSAALRENDGYCLTIQGCSHWNFADRALYSPLRSRTGAGTIRPKRACRIIATAARAFFVEALNGRDRSLVAEAVSVFPEVDVVIQPHHVAPGQSGSESPDEPKRAIQTD